MYLEQQIVDFTTNNQSLTRAIVATGLTILAYIVKKQIFKKVIKKIVNKSPFTWDNELYPFFETLSSIIIFIVGSGYVLIELGVNVKMLLSTIGASSILIAYACKDSMSNIISGLVIKADRPFRVDDYIILPSGEDVLVIKIGLRRSRFLSLKDKDGMQFVITVPNVDLAKNKIKNLTMAEEL